MTNHPTPSPKVSDEPISAERLEELESRLALWCQIREPAPLVKLSSVKEMLDEALIVARELQRLRANIAQWDPRADGHVMIHEGLPQRDADARDAGRYRHIQVHGFPVRNQTGDPDRRWVAFNSRWMMSKEFYGATPSFAIDAAMAALLSASSAGE